MSVIAFGAPPENVTLERLAKLLHAAGLAMQVQNALVEDDDEENESGVLLLWSVWLWFPANPTDGPFIGKADSLTLAIIEALAEYDPNERLEDLDEIDLSKSPRGES